MIKGAVGWFVWFLTVVLLLTTGIAYRVAASYLKVIVERPINLPVPLEDVPYQINGWSGRDVPIRETVQRVAGNDDFINRLYTNEFAGKWANIYVAYTARPRTMRGHRPQVCYVGGGWIHDGTESSETVTVNGVRITCLVHRFHMPTIKKEQIVVLNFYIVNGQITSDQSVFSGIGWRTPNIGGDPARYVTQVQISSIFENSVRAAAQDIVDVLLQFFPDEQGNVKVAEYKLDADANEQ